MDLSEAQGSGSRSEYAICGEEEETKRSCADCGTTKTPLWRGGPDGPKSLCNACGIRSRKRRRALLGLNDGVGTEDVKKIRRSTSGGVSIKRRILGMGMAREVQLQLQRSTAEKQRRKKKTKKMGEEEQAAILLMALSYGSLCTLID